MSKLGDKPAKDMTFREWLIGQALTGVVEEGEGSKYTSERAILHADAVLAAMENEHGG